MISRIVSLTVRTAAIVVLLLPSVRADAEEVFNRLAGQWAGNGTISFNSGSRERIRCRAAYSPSNQDTWLRLELKCASDSYKFELRSDLVSNSGSISGVWSENTRNVAGTLSGRIGRQTVDVTALSPTFSAFLRVATAGNRQTVSIRSPGSEMQEVAISLSRSSGR